MGCGSSRIVPDSSATTTANPVETFIDELLDGGYPLTEEGEEDEAIPPLLEALENKMIAVLTSDASATTITYLKYLAALNDNYQTFNTAAELIVASGKIWHLNRRSLAFLNALSQRDNPVFRRLLQNLSELCVGNALFLEATHIDTVIDLLYKQSQLPEDSLDFIDRFLESRGTPDIESIVQ